MSNLSLGVEAFLVGFLQRGNVCFAVLQLFGKRISLLGFRFELGDLLSSAAVLLVRFIQTLADGPEISTQRALDGFECFFQITNPINSQRVDYTWFMRFAFHRYDAQPLAEHLDFDNLQVLGQQPERFHQVERVLVVNEVIDPERYGNHQAATLLEQVVGLFDEQLRSHQVFEHFADDNGFRLNLERVQREEV